MGDAQVDKIEFIAIPANTFNADSPELTKTQTMGEHLRALSNLWNNMAEAANPDAIKVAYKALQDSKIKIVNLTGLDPEKLVFLGGSRRRRQSKKRKNHKKHNNNE